MKEIRNKTFKNETVELDGFAFYNCIFNGVHFIFRGRSEFGFDNPGFTGQTTMEFADSARLTLTALDALYRTGGSTRSWVEWVIKSFKLPPRKIDH